MKKFLAIDTSSKYLTVIAYSDRAYTTYLTDCAMRHSVLLMQAIEDTLAKAGISAAECDFFAVCVGAGSFTGIRIGISCVKGLAYAYGKPVLPVTSFQIAAYTENGPVLALVDALHGNFYACGFDEQKRVDIPPCYISSDEAAAICRGRRAVSADDISIPYNKVNAADGFLSAVMALGADEKNMIRLGGEKDVEALYIRKSQAEENLKQ